MNHGRVSLLVLAAAALLQAQGAPTKTRMEVKPGAPAAAVHRVVPALEGYARDTLLGDLWKRPGLSQRDRSLVTLAGLIARNQMTELPFYLDLALEDGVRPAEISGMITHLAFYAGWPAQLPGHDRRRQPLPPQTYDLGDNGCLGAVGRVLRST